MKMACHITRDLLNDLIRIVSYTSPRIYLQQETPYFLLP
jgi:hypothetical protein